MNDKIEGTVILEGLIEGPVPPHHDAQQQLEQWSLTAKPMEMTIQSDGGRFSALPSNEPVTVPATGDDASIAIAESLGKLLALFPPAEKMRVFSTLRSIEYRPRLEIKTMYAVGPDGRPATHQERSVAQTVPRDPPIPLRQMLIRGGIGIAVALVLLAISSFLIDYPQLWRNLTASSEPVKVAVYPDVFAPYLRLEVESLNRRDSVLQIRLTRTALYPANDAQLDQLYDHPPTTRPTAATGPATAAAATAPGVTADAPGLLRRRLAVEALARGTCHLDLYDEHGKFLAQVPLRIADLQSAGTVEATISLPVATGRLIVPSSISLVP